MEIDAISVTGQKSSSIKLSMAGSRSTTAICRLTARRPLSRGLRLSSLEVRRRSREGSARKNRPLSRETVAKRVASYLGHEERRGTTQLQRPRMQPPTLTSQYSHSYHPALPTRPPQPPPKTPQQFYKRIQHESPIFPEPGVYRDCGVLSIKGDRQPRSPPRRKSPSAASRAATHLLQAELKERGS
jgi:hypothetical protein